ncbi:hypothetical protein TWF694_010147 [Orbilia ellipsospora]|uniref:Heterokaryon incompatibility domain-containing protein n=1 Tax=Orbilia ellipsospora TaxID=2528407 RepID=A0AAV9X904_9PEZI
MESPVSPISLNSTSPFPFSPGPLSPLTPKRPATYEEQLRDRYIQHEEDSYMELISKCSNLGISLDQVPEPKFFSCELHTNLLHEIKGGDDGEHCQNMSKDPTGLWAEHTSMALNRVTNPSAPFPNRLAQLCYNAEIRNCTHEDCVHERGVLDLTAPPCQWHKFREWAIALIACQACCTHAERLERQHSHMVGAVLLCHVLIRDYKLQSKPMERYLKGGRQYDIDPFEICEIVYWMLTVQTHIGLCLKMKGTWGPSFLPDDVVVPAVAVARERAKKLGVCLYRLQKLVDVAERKQADLPGIMEMARHYPGLTHSGKGPTAPEYDADLYHGKCTPELCPPNRVDTTLKPQLHKCAIDKRSSCADVQYSVEELEKSIEECGVSAWSIQKPVPQPAGVEDKVLAISHVSIDGTGAGPDPKNDQNNTSSVHGCLDKYWRTLAGKLGCTAIWWDAISLPTSPTVRKKEIDSMHHKYAAATHVLVHDNYLLNFKWADDGSPCVALVLSTWFTRGWTALELHAAKSVKVLFKGLTPGNPIIKDLDHDILAADPRYATRGYWIASSIIRRLRRPVESTSDMLSIIRPRVTCKREDRTTIAGLLAGLEPTDCPECLEIPSDSTSDRIRAHRDEHTSRRVFTKLRKIGYASLMHGRKTISESGPWCWAPREVHDIPVESMGVDIDAEGFNLHLPADMLDISKDGALLGNWRLYLVSEEDAKHNITAIPDADYEISKNVDEALVEWEKCAILRQPFRVGEEGVLVSLVGTHSYPEKDKARVLDCRYIGAVIVRRERDENDSDKGVTPERSMNAMVWFGNDEGKPRLRTLDVVRFRADSTYGGSNADEDGWEEVVPSPVLTRVVTWGKNLKMKF